MLSLELKQKIAEYVQQLLAETNHPELPDGEIQFLLHVDGAKDWSWANIRNNSARDNPVPYELIGNIGVGIKKDNKGEKILEQWRQEWK